MKILLAGPYTAGTGDKFREMLLGNDVIEVKTQEEYDAAVECEVVVVRVLKTTEQTMMSKKQLHAIIRWGAGYDSVDIEAAGRLGIKVATTPGVNAYAVSELAVALMLTVGRGIVKQNDLTHNGTWDNKIGFADMTTLNHKIVGIIGGGNIGRKVATQVHSFGAEILYYDLFRLSKEQEQECSMVYTPLTELLTRSDVVSLHVPLLDTTYHLLDKKELALMKKNAILINTARGGLVNDEELANLLKADGLLGAGLDCVENENMSESPFAEFDNVIITPHMGGNSNDLSEEMVPVIAGQIRLFMETGDINFVVNRELIQK